jgi:Do/DeqQ family serine protease
MSTKLFNSKRFFIFNVALVSMMVGAMIALTAFSCSPRISAKETALAEDNQQNVSLNTLENLQNSFRSVAEKVLPVVVEVDVTEIKTQKLPEGWNLPFNPFSPFDNDSEEGEKERKFENRGLGSGVIVKKIGKKVYVLTNNHVVGSANKINITLYDEREYKAKLVGKDERKDLALVVFETKEKDIPVAKLGNSNQLYVGDWVLAIGNPYGFESTVTAGIVSALGRRNRLGENISDFIQTDASINQGNSGGALVNLKGEVIGINTWITTPTGGSIGLGFAIPINNAKKAIDDIIKSGEVEYGWLGVSIGPATPQIVEDMSLNGKKGAFIYQVFKKSPADKGGLLPGDFVLSMDGLKVRDADEFVQMIGDLPAGKVTVFELIRNNEKREVKVKIGKREGRDKIAQKNKNLWPGLNIVTLNDEIKKELKIEEKQKGVVITDVIKQTIPAIAGLRAGDVITQINSKSITNMADFYSSINDKSNRELKIEYIREGVELSIGIKR